MAAEQGIDARQSVWAGGFVLDRGWPVQAAGSTHSSDCVGFGVSCRAACAGQGMHAPLEGCNHCLSTGQPNPVEPWTDNEVRGGRIGVYMNKGGLPNCTLIQGFTVWQCQDYGIYFQVRIHLGGYLLSRCKGKHLYHVHDSVSAA